MTLETLQDTFIERFVCHCGKVGECVVRPAGTVLLRCSCCGATHSVTNRETGQPRGVPASPACRALRYQAHALIDCLGKSRSYGGVLSGPDGQLHFASAGVTSSIVGVKKLREALVSEKRRTLMRLQDNDEGVATLSEAATCLQPSDAEALLHGHAAAGHVRLLEVLLKATAANVNAARQKDGCTALHLAQYHQHVDAVRLLLALGADPDARNKWGETPSESARAAPAPQ